MFSVVVVSLRRSCKCGGYMSRRGEAFVRPGSHLPVIDRQPRAALSLSSGARHGARGLSRRIGTLTFSVVVASCGVRGGEAVVRPGSQPPVIDWQPRAALSLTSGARHGARGLSGGIGTRTFSVVVASCGGRGGEAFVRPGSHPPVINRQPRAAVFLSSRAWSARVKRKARNANILCCRRVVRRVQEQEGGLVRTPGVPTAGDRLATKSGLDLILLSTH